MSKIIKAVFTGRFCTCRRVFQWDTDDKLQFVNLDLPQNYTVDFANSLTGQSVPVLATSDTVQIPPDLFVPGSEIYAWVWVSDTNGGHTKCQATIPIDPRAQRSGTSPTPAQASAWDEAVQVLNEATRHAPIIQNGYWFIWDSTAGEYVTTDVKAAGTDGENGNIIWWTTDHVTASGDNAGIQRRKLHGPEGLTPAVGDYVFAPSAGNEGEPTTLYVIISASATIIMTALGSIVGPAGYSPDVTITEITGGHRVTITDEDHPDGQSFDVMDGESVGISPYTSNPAPLGTASPGSSDDYARGDHVHENNLFVCVYGTTTNSEINTALNAGKAVVVPHAGYIYYLSAIVSSTRHIFGAAGDGTTQCVVCDNGSWSVQIYTIPTGSDATPQALGTAAAGSSTNFSRADHVHANPTASDVGAVAVARGVEHAGEFVVVGSDGNITSVTMSAWQGGNY